MVAHIRKILKKFLKISYDGEGRFNFCIDFKVHIKLPGKFSAAWLYDVLYGKLPIEQNKIVMDNYMGRGYGCNCKYLADYLLQNYPGKFDIVWCATKKTIKKGGFPEGVRTVVYNSSAAKKEYATAKVWISNYHKISTIKKGLHKKEGQYFIETWHGSLGIKRIENDVPGLTKDENWLNLAKKSSEMVDYWVSNSDFETAIYKRAFWNVRNVLEYGHPRNDVFFNEVETIRNKVRGYYGLEEKNILFYAPTFREDYRLDCYQIDYPALLDALSERFGGDWVVLCRLHPRVMKFAKDVVPKDERIINATQYPDIQELLAASDCMISDYSSCIFDFMLSYKPAFVFATDIEEYADERGFYFPLESTPFPIAVDNEQLVRAVQTFNEVEYHNNVDDFLKEKGCIEDGHASERVVNKILELMGEEP